MRRDASGAGGVLDALTLETVMGQGEVAQMWRDYLLAAFAEINDVNARKIVLYLARHDPEQRDRDRIFAMVFRRIYGSEIQKVSQKEIEDDFKRQLDAARRRIARQRGQLAEHQVRYRLLAASLAGASLEDVVVGDVPTTIRKGRLHLDLPGSGARPAWLRCQASFPRRRTGGPLCPLASLQNLLLKLPGDRQIALELVPRVLSFDRSRVRIRAKPRDRSMVIPAPRAAEESLP